MRIDLSLDTLEIHMHTHRHGAGDETGHGDGGGHLDGDGDVDIVLGAYNNGPSEGGYPTAIRVRWQANPVPLVILRNLSLIHI